MSRFGTGRKRTVTGPTLNSEPEDEADKDGGRASSAVDAQVANDDHSDMLQVLPARTFEPSRLDSSTALPTPNFTYLCQWRLIYRGLTVVGPTSGALKCIAASCFHS